MSVAEAADGALYEMTQVAPKFRVADEKSEVVAASIGLAASDIVRMEWVSTGIFWLVAQVASLEAMMRVHPDYDAAHAHPTGHLASSARRGDTGR